MSYSPTPPAQPGPASPPGNRWRVIAVIAVAASVLLAVGLVVALVTRPDGLPDTSSADGKIELACSLIEQVPGTDVDIRRITDSGQSGLLAAAADLSVGASLQRTGKLPGSADPFQRLYALVQRFNEDQARWTAAMLQARAAC